MDAFITLVVVVVIAAVVAYLKVPKFKEIVDKAVFSRFKPSSAEVATPVPLTPNELIVEAPSKPAVDDFGPGPDTFVPLTPEPQNQEEWDEYRNSFIPSTRVYIREKFEPAAPEVKAALINNSSPRYLPTFWDGKPFRMIAKLEKGVTRINFMDDGKEHDISTCAATSVKPVLPTFTLINTNGEFNQLARSDSTQFRFGKKAKAKTAPGVNTIEITVKDSGGLWVRFK